MKKNKLVRLGGNEVAAVECEFDSILALISKRRDRALMAVNVESLMTY